MNISETTIVACCTPQGSGALALIRLSGPDAVSIAETYFRSAAKNAPTLSDVTTHTVHYGRFAAHNSTTIDHVMVTVMHAPRTFTGEHTVEITCHNNPFIIQAILSTLLTAGALPAQAGEFTRRAYENKKLDLVQAEAVYDVIHAQTELALKKSLAQLEGSLSHWITAIEQQLVKALAWCEASFEFLDEGGDFHHEIKQQLETITTTIATVLEAQHNQHQLRHGIRVALLGSVNAGKSSLFNALLGHKRAIVTPVAGTTRDTIEATICKQGVTYTLIDTAGLRQTEDTIEAEGIERSWHEAQKADIILLVVDKSRTMTQEEETIYNGILNAYPKKTCIVATKNDLQSLTEWQEHAAFYVTTAEQTTVKKLEEHMLAKAQTLLAQHESPFLLNQRQLQLLQTVEYTLMQLTPTITEHVQYELLSYELRQLLEVLSDLTGKSVSEKALDMVFKEFCVGK